MLELRYPSISDKNAMIEANHSGWESDFVFLHYLQTIANNDMEKYIEILPKFANGELIPDGHVPSTFLLAFDSNNNVVGRVSIRHYLIEALKKDGGHIGYGVVPEYRNKGYATEILKMSLLYVKANLPELDKVMLTCDEGNIGSIKTIENNGGKFFGHVENKTELKKRIYWIGL